MEQKEQTAVEWLEEKLDRIGLNANIIGEYIKQSKEMEKQQRKQSYDNGYANGQLDLITE